MNNIWVDIGLSLGSGILITIGLVQLYRFTYTRQTGQEVAFIAILFGDLYRGKSLEYLLREHFFSGILFVVLGVAGAVVMFVVF